MSIIRSYQSIALVSHCLYMRLKVVVQRLQRVVMFRETGGNLG